MSKVKAKKVPARGVRQHYNGWLVEHGTTPRVRAYFLDREIAIAYKAHLLATNKLPELRLDRESFLVSAGRLTRQTRVVTPATFVEVGLDEKIKRHPVSQRQWESNARAALIGFELLGLAHDRSIRPFSRDLGDRLVAVMRNQFPSSTVKNVIRMLNIAGISLWKAEKIPFNPFAETNTFVHYAITRKKWLNVSQSLTVDQSVQVLRAIPKSYRFLMILMILTGIRIAEAMALTVGDVNTDQRIISIIKQRSGSSSTTRNRTKSYSSSRMIPIGEFLTDQLIRYIFENHGFLPSDAALHNKYLSRYLFVGNSGGAMNPRTATDSIRKARQRVCLDSASLRSQVKPAHDCRSMFITECSTQTNLPPALISRYVGHKTIRGAGSLDIPAAMVTGVYNRPGILHLRDFIENLESGYVKRFISALNGWDPIGDEQLTDPISFDEACEMLAINESKFKSYIINGTVKGLFVGVDLLFERIEIAQLRDSLNLLNLTTLSKGEVIRKLVINEKKLQELFSNGILNLDSSGLSTRVNRSDVERLAMLWEVRIYRASNWLRVSQTAKLLNCSADTVRRLVDEGKISGWVDPINGRKERFVNPSDVEQIIKKATFISTQSVARKLKITRTQAEAILFRVRFELRTRGARNSMTLEEYDQVKLHFR